MLLSIEAAASAIKTGEIIAYPTEAIFGLGCDPDNQNSLQKLVDLKSRESDKGLILVGSTWQQLEPFVDVSDSKILEPAMDSWPGPVTWIMPASARCTELLTGNRPTIAVRVSAHNIVRALCDQCESALVSTSANLSGQPPLSNAQEIETAFGGQIAGVVAGELGGLENATSIFDVSTGVQLR